MIISFTSQYEWPQSQNTHLGVFVKIFVMVCMRVGKEFPGMRQNERRIEFIRVADAVRRVGWLKEEPAPFVDL